MHTIARYYATPAQMSVLFMKITEQMIVNCRGFVNKNGNMWEQESPELIGDLKSCVKLYDCYREAYDHAKASLAEKPAGKQFDFNENVIFGKFTLFHRRVEKLIDL